MIPKIVVAQDASFNFSQLYKMLKAWFDLHRYDFYEKEFVESLQEQKQFNTIKWKADRKIDDYVKFHIEIRIKIFNAVKVEGKKAMLLKGKVQMAVESFLEKDYEDRWENSPMGRFTRALFDTLVVRDKLNRYSGELRDETYEVFNEAKAFLKLHQYKG